MGTSVGYYQGGYNPGPRLGPVTRGLLIINSIVFLTLFILAHGFSPSISLTAVKLLAFSLDGLRQGHVWQLLTYGFSEIRLTSFLINAFSLFSFGPIMEAGLGKRRYLGLYFSGIVGGAMVVLLLEFIGNWVNLGRGMLLGSHGPMLAIFVVYSLFYPNAVVNFWGVIPMKSKYLAWVMAGMALLDSMEHSLGGGRLFPLAELGGALAGYLWWRWFRWQRTRSSASLFDLFRYKKHKLSIITDNRENNEQEKKEYYH